MSILTLVYPAHVAVAVVQSFSGSIGAIARAVVGLCVFGLVATLAMIFKPLIIGVLRAAQLVMHPRFSLHQRQMLQRIAGAQLLTRLAKEVETVQPTLAAEMQYLAARG